MTLLALLSLCSSLIHTSSHRLLERYEWGEGNGNPLHYSCLEKSMDRGAWRAAVHGVT